MTAPVAPPPAAGGRRKGLLFSGLVLLVAGIGAGAVLVATAGSVREDTVKKFARAPVGCTTTLQFTKSATFTLYVETKGVASNLGGDCAANGKPYNHTDDNRPKVTLTLVDDQDHQVKLTDAGTLHYDAGGFKGQAVQQAVITKAGTYRLTVASDAKDVAVAVGGNPDTDADMRTNAGYGAIGVGVVVGGLLTLLGWRKKKVATVTPAPAPSWGAAPSTVPGWQPQQPYVAPAPAPPDAAPPHYLPPPAPAPPAPPAQHAPPSPGPGTPPVDPGWGAPHP
jgi:hypothetical protein